MNTKGAESKAVRATATFPTYENLPPQLAVDDALSRAREHLLSLQKPDGHWVAELEGDSILESEYVLLKAFLGQLSDPRIPKLLQDIKSKQGSHGGWSNHPEGPVDISATVKSYFAFKLGGFDPAEPFLQRARQAILDHGGAESVNSFTRFYLALLDQVPYSYCPTVPPELIWAPDWFPINLYKMSAWTRTIVVPLSLVSAFKPVTRVPEDRGIRELFRNPPTRRSAPAAARFTRPWLSWANLFRCADRGLKMYESLAPTWFRKKAIQQSTNWMLERFDGSDGLGAIFPPMVYTIIALKCLGYADDSAEWKWAEKQLDDLILDDERGMRLQPCFSPVWDTALSMIALAESGVEKDNPALGRASDWLIQREIRTPGDWAYFNKGIEPSGWPFEYNNRFYADLDDTAMALIAFAKTGQTDRAPVAEAVQRATSFLLQMRCRDHGWAAFDKDIDNPVLEHVPFADHNAMLDPSCPDITARVLEMLGGQGRRVGDQVVDQAVAFLLKRQEPEGCWYGRWGVNYIYGTWQALTGLACVGFDMQRTEVRRAVDWLLSVQQPNGGWGETCASYDDRNLMGTGETTASQSAWAIMALVSAGDFQRPETALGVHYLLQTQNQAGDWNEEPFTGAGFPRVFYLKYHYYRIYFPLMALARYRRASLSGSQSHNPSPEKSEAPR